MQEKSSVSGEQLAAMLAMVAKKMGKSPEALERELRSGSVSDERASQILGNKEELKTVLESQQVKEMLRELGKK